MSMVDDVGAFLEATGHGTLAVDLFKRHAPDEPGTLTLVIQLEGEEPELIQNTPDVEIEQPRLQVWARSSNPEVAESRLRGPYRELMRIRNIVLGDSLYISMVPSHPPTVMERDENGLYAALCEFRVRKELSSGT